MGASFIRKVGRFALPMIAVLMVMLMAGACGNGTGNGANGEDSTSFKIPSREDYGDLSWTEAFENIHEKMSSEYAFTEWRGIDWDYLYDEFQPLIASAEEKGSLEDYYVTLRKYLCSLRDGHVTISGDDLGLTEKLYGGGFGLTVEELDDGTIIANWIQEGGPAQEAGMRAGAEITAWGGNPVETALEETDTCFSLYPPATDEMLGCMQRYFLVRASVGEAMEVSYINPGETSESGAVLTAFDDGMVTLDHSYSLVGFPPPENIDGVTKIVVSETLEGGYGYIKIEGEYDLPSQQQGDHTPTLELFREAVNGFIESGAPGLVIDVRSNDGGSDQMVADMMSLLFEESSFYEYQNWYNADTGGLEIILVDENTGRFVDPGEGITIEPGSPVFEGPVVALVNPACISSGEGIAMSVGRLPNGEVVGFRGTNGSFGMVYGAMIEMPGGYSITYPLGQSLDEDEVVQVESRDGKGGVSPGVTVPLNAENAIRAGNGEDVELEYALELLKGM